jgi:hypothetical protein
MGSEKKGEGKYLLLYTDTPSLCYSHRPPDASSSNGHANTLWVPLLCLCLPFGLRHSKPRSLLGLKPVFPPMCLPFHLRCVSTLSRPPPPHPIPLLIVLPKADRDDASHARNTSSSGWKSSNRWPRTGQLAAFDQPAFPSALLLERQTRTSGPIHVQTPNRSVRNCFVFNTYCRLSSLILVKRGELQSRWAQTDVVESDIPLAAWWR